METPSLRVRLEFGDRSILSRTQRSDGMNRSWILLKLQQHRTISDVCTHLLHIFKLHRSCPNGILLSMEGFVLPPFESTEILKDKEILCVKKKGGNALEAADAGNLREEVEAGELEPGNNNLLLLANDKFDKETEEYESESDEIDEEELQNEDSLEEEVSKKRKASTKLQKPKKKKRCLEVVNDAEDEAVKQTEEHQDNVEEVKLVANVPESKKKMPSRSARRKKAKRKWMQELAKIAKKKPQGPQSYSKPVVNKAENKEDNGRPKGLLHWKQASKNQGQNGDLGADVGPVGTKREHIRFDSHDEDQPAKQTGVSNETKKWKGGSSSKKRGPKWSAERFSTPRRNNRKVIDKEAFKMMFKDAKVPLIDLSDFDKLPPTCEPKEGDVIAYRLLQLSSAWIPEFSSFRVGRISYYDARDIVLIPVPEYPIESDKMEDDGPNGSLYGADGTLEINYSALVDVRNVKIHDPDATELVSIGVENQTPMSTEKTVSNSTENQTNVFKDSNPGHGEQVSPWEQFSKVNQTSIVNSDGGPGPSDVPDNGSGPVEGPNVTNKAESSGAKDEEHKGSRSPGNNNPSMNTNDINSVSSWSGWPDVDKAVGPSENDVKKGSSWGRPWSSFVVSRGSLVNEHNKEGEWCRGGSSRGNGKPWSRGGTRGRGQGRGFGRGRGRNGK